MYIPTFGHDMTFRWKMLYVPAALALHPQRKNWLLTVRESATLAEEPHMDIRVL